MYTLVYYVYLALLFYELLFCCGRRVELSYG